MVEKKDLIDEGNCLLIDEWKLLENELIANINKVISMGNVDVTTMLIMKELLESGEIRTRNKSLEEWFDDQ